MLKATAAIPLLALSMGLPAAAPLRASDDPVPDKVYVLSDEPEDLDTEIETLVVPEEPETPPAAPGDMVVRIERDHHRGYLGVELIEMTPELREHFGAPRDAGVLIGKVEKDSPAAKAGLQVGDIVTAAGGSRIESTGDLSRAVRGKKAGETVPLELSRDRTRKQVTVTVGQRPDREIRIGDLGPLIQKKLRVVRDHDWEAPLVMPMQNLERVEEQLKDLDRRLKDLEKKLPSK